MSEIITRRQEKGLLRAGLVKGDFTFAGGDTADTKFDFDRIKDKKFRTVIGGLALLIASRDPQLVDIDAFVTVANGATRIGPPLSEALGGIPHIRTGRREDGSFYLLDEIGEDIEDVVIVDDVFTKGTNSTKVAEELHKANVRALHVAVALDRSGKSAPTIEQGGLTVPVNSLMRQYIPTKERRV